MVALHFALSWARMAVKASKSKGLVIVNGKIVYAKSLCVTLGVKHQAIPFITDSPVRFFRRTISHALSDKHQADSQTLKLKVHSHV